MQNGITRKTSRILLSYNTFLCFHIFKKIMKKSNISIIRKNIAMNKFAVSSHPMLKFWTLNSQSSSYCRFECIYVHTAASPKKENMTLKKFGLQKGYEF